MWHCKRIVWYSLYDSEAALQMQRGSSFLFYWAASADTPHRNGENMGLLSCRFFRDFRAFRESYFKPVKAIFYLLRGKYLSIMLREKYLSQTISPAIEGKYHKRLSRQVGKGQRATSPDP